MGCQCAKKDTGDENEISKGGNASTEVKSIPNKPPPDPQTTFNSQLHTNIQSGIISPSHKDPLSSILPHPSSDPSAVPFQLFEGEAQLQPHLPPSIREKSSEVPEQVKEPAPRTDNSFANQSVGKTSELESKRRKIEYNTEVFNLINKIRVDPAAFAGDVEEAIGKITTVDGKLIYKGAVKVSIKTGESVFQDAARRLREMEAMEPFELSEDIAIAVPEEEEKMKNTKVLQELVEEKKEEGVDIDWYFKDLIKDPYTSVLLMVIDDNGKNTGKKRDVVLGREYTKIAVTSRRVKKTFCAYFTFAK